MLALQELNPAQAMAASMFFRQGKLLLILPRQVGGKTELGCRLAVALLRANMSTSSLFLAKDHPSILKATSEKFSRLCPNSEFKVTTKGITLRKNPQTVHYFSSVDHDPDRARGGTMSYVHWSEAAFSKIEGGATVFDVYQKVLLPSLTVSGGKALIESTTNGMNGFKELYDEAPKLGIATLKLGLDRYVEMGICTQDFFNEQQLLYHPDIFRQELLCEWVTFKGAAYPELDDSHIDPDMLPCQSGEELLLAIDWGYSPSATAVIYAVMRNNVLCIFDERFEFGEQAFTTAEAVYRMTLRSGSEYRACGDHEPDRMDTLREHGIPVVNAVKRQPLVARTNIKELLYFDRIKFHPKCKNTIEELKSAVWDGKKDGEIDYDMTPNKGHYDCEAALRYLADTFKILHRKEG